MELPLVVPAGRLWIVAEDRVRLRRHGTRISMRDRAYARERRHALRPAALDDAGRVGAKGPRRHNPRHVPTLQNDTFLRACLRQPTPYTPLWLMRQAGRYLPEYKATRVKAGNSFMGLATNVQYATEVTLQPLDRYALDAAILFSRHPHRARRHGPGPELRRRRGPALRAPGARRSRGGALAVPDLDKLRYVFDAVTSIRQALNGRVPLIGFSGSPWTLACYMVEGAGSDDYRLVKTMLYSRPDLMHRILDVNAAGRDGLPERADRRRRAGRDDLRQLGRRAGRRRLPALQPGLHAPRRRRAAAREGRPAHPVHRLHQGRRARGWTRSPPSAPTSSAWTGRSTWAAPAPRWATASRCKATSTPTCCSRRRRGRGARGGGRARQLRPPAAARRHLGRPHLQPRPRHQPAHAARARHGAGRGRARHSRRCARLPEQRLRPAARQARTRGK